MRSSHAPRLAPAAILCLLLLASCKGTEDASTDAVRTYVEVRNRNYLSMEVYVLDQTSRVRLGRVGAGKTDTFLIPAYLVAGGTAIQFVMESSGPSPTVLSEALTVVPGEKILLVIPNTR